MRGGWRRGQRGVGRAVGTLLVGLCLTGTTQADEGQRKADLTELGIEQLMNIEVTSVSKRQGPLLEAAAAIFVITQEDIRRRGFTRIPEALRMVPGLQVARIDGNKWAITARGFDAQFSDKLLVLIDGRTVYNPLFSGVDWDVQDVPPEDIERIEVISGPGATLWGANAINGVINIITKQAGETQGLFLDVAGGNLQQSATLQYGGKVGDDVAYRLYAKGFIDGDTPTAAGQHADDQWNKPQGGFRIDWTASAADRVTIQGDAYRGDE